MKALIVKTSSLGDVVHSFPVAEYLHGRGIQVDWVVEKECAPLVERHPAVTQVYRVNTRQWRKGKDLKGCRNFFRALRSQSYDLLFDLQGNSKSAFFTFLAKAKKKVGFGKKSIPEWPNLLVTNERFEPKGKGVQQRYLSLAGQHFYDSSAKGHPSRLDLTPAEEQRLKELQPQLAGAVLICPCSRWQNKMLPEDTWIAFLRRIKERTLLCWGSEEEKLLVQRIANEVPGATLLDRLSLPLLQNAMALTKAVVSVDSLALHLAASAGTPTLSLFTSSSAAEYAPTGHACLQAGCPYGISFERRCPRLRTCTTGACRNDLSIDQITEAWNNLALHES